MITDKAFQLLAAGLAMFAVFGIGIGQGINAAKAVEAIGRNPEAVSKIRSQFILSAAITETGALYCLLVAFLLIFVG
ncbi:MAG: ATP synthase F0 subunit C [Malacoplasma sp.]|nr:ATP synthase F0 subunit C [Malacoplasma sp.]